MTVMAQDIPPRSATTRAHVFPAMGTPSTLATGVSAANRSFHVGGAWPVLPSPAISVTRVAARGGSAGQPCGTGSDAGRVTAPSPSETKSSSQLPPSIVEKTSKAFVSGTISGWGQTLAGQPFDTVKVRLQANPGQYSGPMQCFMDCVKREGVAGLYKGTMAPMIGIGFCNALQFAGYEWSKERIENGLRMQQAASGTSDASDATGRTIRPLTLGEHFLCGAVGGFINTATTAPVEHIRIRTQLQTGQATEKQLYKGVMDCAQKIYAQHGIRGLYKGVFASAMRDTPAYGVYFLAYNFMIRDLLKTEPSKMSSVGTAVCGGIAGFTLWLTTFPMDLVKSKIQSDDFKNPKYKSYMHCVSETYKAGGLRGFYTGWLPCALRAIPVNAVIFTLFELTQTVLGRS